MTQREDDEPSDPGEPAGEAADDSGESAGDAARADAAPSDDAPRDDAPRDDEPAPESEDVAAKADDEPGKKPAKKSRKKSGGKSEEDDDDLEATEAAKSNMSAALSVLGFVAALAVGYFVGQRFFGNDAPAVEFDQTELYAVQLRGDEPQQGPDDALVTIIEFADYQCPYCARAVEPLHEAMDDYKAEVRLIYKHYPLPNHQKAAPAAKFAAAAGLQGKFWELHARLFENGADITDARDYAKELGLDMRKLGEDLDGEAVRQIVESDRIAGGALMVTGTPAFFVNGHAYPGLKQASQWEQIIEHELKIAKRVLDSGVGRDQVYTTIMQNAQAVHESKAALDPVPPAPQDPEPPEPGAPPEAQPTGPTADAAAGPALKRDPLETYRVDVTGRPGWGAEQPMVTVVAFTGPFCDRCKAVLGALKLLTEAHKDVRVVVRTRPLQADDGAREAMALALGAGAQGKLFEALSAVAKAGAPLDAAAITQALALDAAKLTAASETAKGWFVADVTDAKRLGIGEGPAVFINGRSVPDPTALDGYDAIVQQERKRAAKLVADGAAPAQVYGKLMATAAAGPKGGG